MIIFAIDPGFKQSGYVDWDGQAVLEKNIIDNELLLKFLRKHLNNAVPKRTLVIEQIKSYGMSVGQTTFDTVFWSGCFWEAYKGEKHLIPRIEVKKHICNDGRAKDGNIIQALADRFAYGVRNRGKGIKSDKGFFYGFHDDIWQAMGLAVTFYDQNENREDKK